MLNLSKPANDALAALSEGIFNDVTLFDRDVKLFYLRLETMLNKLQTEIQGIDRKIADEAMWDFAEFCTGLPSVDLSSSESERFLIKWEQTLKSP